MVWFDCWKASRAENYDGRQQVKGHKSTTNATTTTTTTINNSHFQPHHHNDDGDGGSFTRAASSSFAAADDLEAGSFLVLSPDGDSGEMAAQGSVRLRSGDETEYHQRHSSGRRTPSNSPRAVLRLVHGRITDLPPAAVKRAVSIDRTPMTSLYRAPSQYPSHGMPSLLRNLNSHHHNEGGCDGFMDLSIDLPLVGADAAAAAAAAGVGGGGGCGGGLLLDRYASSSAARSGASQSLMLQDGGTACLLPMHINNCLMQDLDIQDVDDYSEFLRHLLGRDKALLSLLHEVCTALVAGRARTVHHTPASQPSTPLPSHPPLHCERWRKQLTMPLCIQTCYSRGSDGTLHPALLFEHIARSSMHSSGGMGRYRLGLSADVAAGGTTCTSRYASSTSSSSRTPALSHYHSEPMSNGPVTVPRGVVAQLQSSFSNGARIISGARAQAAAAAVAAPSTLAPALYLPLLDRSDMMRSLAVLAHCPLVTLLDMDGGVLFQNAASRKYWGALVSAGNGGGGAAVVAAALPPRLSSGGGRAVGSAGVQTSQLLEQLFSLQPQWREVALSELAAEQKWRRVLEVPGCSRRWGQQQQSAAALLLRPDQLSERGSGNEEAGGPGQASGTPLRRGATKGRSAPFSLGMFQKGARSGGLDDGKVASIQEDARPPSPPSECMIFTTADSTVEEAEDEQSSSSTSPPPPLLASTSSREHQRHHIHDAGRNLNSQLALQQLKQACASHSGASTTTSNHHHPPSDQQHRHQQHHSHPNNAITTSAATASAAGGSTRSSTPSHNRSSPPHAHSLHQPSTSGGLETGHHPTSDPTPTHQHLHPHHHQHHPHHHPHHHQHHHYQPPSAAAAAAAGSEPSSLRTSISVPDPFYCEQMASRGGGPQIDQQQQQQQMSRLLGPGGIPAAGVRFGGGGSVSGSGVVVTGAAAAAAAAAMTAALDSAQWSSPGVVVQRQLSNASYATEALPRFSSGSSGGPEAHSRSQRRISLDARSMASQVMSRAPSNHVMAFVAKAAASNDRDGALTGRPGSSRLPRFNSVNVAQQLDEMAAESSQLDCSDLLLGASLGLSLSVHEGVAQDGGGQDDEVAWHELQLTMMRDPVSGAQVLLLLQEDVTQRAVLEHHLSALMEAQFSMMEQMFPRHAMEYLMENDLRTVPENLGQLAKMHESVTILFTDIVGFTSMSKAVSPAQVMDLLNKLFTLFDKLAADFSVYKVETAGDCYIVAGGLMEKDADGFTCVAGHDEHPEKSAERVLAFGKALQLHSRAVCMPHDGSPVKVRVGIHTGPVVTGVIGLKLPKFSVFGTTMNTASRMESTCPVGCIQISEATMELIQDAALEATGGVEVKGLGMTSTYLWRSPTSEDDIARTLSALETTAAEAAASAAAAEAKLTSGELFEVLDGSDASSPAPSLRLATAAGAAGAGGTAAAAAAAAATPNSSSKGEPNSPPERTSAPSVSVKAVEALRTWRLRALTAVPPATAVAAAAAGALNSPASRRAAEPPVPPKWGAEAKCELILKRWALAAAAAVPGGASSRA